MIHLVVPNPTCQYQVSRGEGPANNNHTSLHFTWEPEPEVKEEKEENEEEKREEEIVSGGEKEW